MCTITQSYVPVSFAAQKWLLQLQVVSKNAKVDLNRVDALEKASHAPFDDVSLSESVC